MFNWLTLLVAALFFTVGVYFLAVKEFREPTFWKLYFPPFYEKGSKENQLIVYRKLKNRVRVWVGWYFLAASVLIFVLLILVNWQCPASVSSF